MDLLVDSSFDVTVELETLAREQPLPRTRARAEEIPTVDLADGPSPGFLRRDHETLSATLVDIGPPTVGDTRTGFGPGVPDGAAVRERQRLAVRGARGRGRRRAERRPLLPGLSWYLVAALVAGAVVWHFWPRHPADLYVGDVRVTTDTRKPDCDQTVTVHGTIRTNGVGGTLTYRWKRSDGSKSLPLHEAVREGEKSVSVQTTWSFHGRGRLHARALLEVTSPPGPTASVDFDYSCRRPARQARTDGGE
ncbi:hypothetical protein AB0O74_32785 [Streptomyces rubiginosohelvolus]|uniref:hypothetical protein n=1 Tax=Streptomyces rubiginosohelvolus TaxID=67362 RepID=UPI003412C7A9